MSAFKLQRLANQYPLWTKLRSDPSSMGQRLLAAYANYIDFAEAELLRFRDEFHVHKWHMGHAELYTFFLEGADELNFATAAGGALIPALPTSITAEHATLGTLTLVHDNDLEDLLYGAPDRVSLLDTQAIVDLEIWNSNTPEIINGFTYPERLTISVTGSTKFNKKNATRDRLFSGFNGLILEGRDINGTPTIDNIPIRDDGVYVTRSIWSKLDEIPSIDGFNGDIVIGYKQASFPYILDPYHVGVLDDVEGALKLKLDVAGGQTHLVYFTDRFKLGSAYRTGIVELDNDELIVENQLLDSNSAAYNGVDLAISYENTKLYVIDDTGILHIYDHGWNTFLPPSLNIETRRSHIGLDALNSYVRLNAIEPMWTFHRRPTQKIERVLIRRISPSGTEEYLQGNLSWAGTAYEFLGQPGAVDAAGSWQDLKFNVEYTELGQWEFYAVTQAEGEITTYYTGVLVDSQVAEVSIDTGITSPTGIFFTEGGELCIMDATNFYKFEEHRDRYFIDAERQQVVLREKYISVEVIP